MGGGRSVGCLKSKRCDVNFYKSSATRKTATIEIVLHTPPLMLETSNEESESDEVEVLLTFSLLLLLSRLGAIDRPCLVHVLGCDIFEIDFGNLGLVIVGPFFCVLASTAGWGGSGQWLRVLIVDWWSTFVER